MAGPLRCRQGLADEEPSPITDGIRHVGPVSEVDINARDVQPGERPPEA